LVVSLDNTHLLEDLLESFIDSLDDISLYRLYMIYELVYVSTTQRTCYNAKEISMEFIISSKLNSWIVYQVVY